MSAKFGLRHSFFSHFIHNYLPCLRILNLNGERIFSRPQMCKKLLLVSRDAHFCSIHATLSLTNKCIHSVYPHNKKNARNLCCGTDSQVPLWLNKPPLTGRLWPHLHYKYYYIKRKISVTACVTTLCFYSTQPQFRHKASKSDAIGILHAGCPSALGRGSNQFYAVCGQQTSAPDLKDVAAISWCRGGQRWEH